LVASDREEPAADLSSSDRDPKMSSAVSEPFLSEVDIDSEADRILDVLERFAMEGSRKGLRDSGLGGGSSKGESWEGETTGEAARLRKGLLEERLSVKRWSFCSGWRAAMAGR